MVGDVGVSEGRVGQSAGRRQVRAAAGVGIGAAVVGGGREQQGNAIGATDGQAVGRGGDGAALRQRLQVHSELQA